MYYDYFGFHQPPFRITPDTSLFYPGGERGAVLEALVYAVTNGEGIVKVVGEVGSGKTMLCRMLEQELPDRVEVVYLANPSLSPENTLHAIAFELGLDLPAATSRFEVMNRLQDYLLQRHGENRQVVVFVEEAQGMPLATLEEVRLLSNLETQHNKLLQIVLFGQPELDNMIARPEIRQLKERITYSFRLNPFKTGDINDYLNSRIRACGYRSGTLFDRAAVNEIERHSHGLLRRINILADKALLAAYAENNQRVTAKHIRKAASDSEFVGETRRWWQRPSGMAAVLGGLALLALLAVVAAGLGPALKPVPEPFLNDAAPPGVSGDRTATAPAEESADSPLPGGDTEQPETDAQAAAGESLAGTTAAPVEKAEKTETRDDAAGSAGGDTTAAAAEESPAPAAESTPEETQPETAATPGLSDVNAKPAQQLYTVIELGGLEEATLSRLETDRLLRQLQEVPPETVVLSDGPAAGELCERCRSIIYRPVKRVENL